MHPQWHSEKKTLSTRNIKKFKLIIQRQMLTQQYITVTHIVSQTQTPKLVLLEPYI